MPDEAPYRNVNFRVEIAGLPELEFRDVVLPETRIEVVEYRVGSDPGSRTRKLPGRALTGNVVLKRGIDHDLSLWVWFKSVRDGNLDRRDGFIALLDSEGTEVRRWNLSRVWPVAYEPSALHALKTEVAIETLELACEAIDIED
jgi:phage tail-like protein